MTAAHPGAAEHRRRLVHAWRPARGRACTGSTNNTFHKNGDAVRHHPHRGLRPRRAAGGVDRAVGRARRAEGRPDRVGRRAQRLDPGADRSTSGPSPPVAAWRRTSSARRATALRRRAVHRLVRPAVRPPGRVSPDSDPFPAAAPTPATGWTGVPTSYSPAQEMRMRVLDGDGRQVRPERLHLRQQQRRPHELRPGAVLAHEERRGRGRRPAAGRVGRRQGDRSTAARWPARPPACWSRSRPWPPTCPASGCSTPRSTRAIATWPTWPGEPGFTGVRRVPRRRVPDLDRGRLRDPRGRRRQRGDLRRAGPLLVDRPLADARVHRRDLRARPAPGRHADHRRVPAPVPRPGHQAPAQRCSQPGVRRRGPRRRQGRTRRSSARRSSARPTRRPTQTLAPGPLAGRQGPDHVRRLRPRLRAAVPRDRRQQAAGRAGPAVASRRPRTAAPATGETIGKAKACWAGGALQIYLNLAGRDPAGGGLQQVAAADEASHRRGDQGEVPRPDRPQRLDRTTATPRAGR